jgi:phosphoglycolate phosphatase
MGFDLLIFDFDGTLVDTRLDITNAVNDMLERFGRPRKGIEEVTSYIGDGIVKIVERTMGASGVDVRETGASGADRGGTGPSGVGLEEAVSAFREAYARRLLENTAPYPGVLEALAGLDGKVKTIFTNKAYEYTKAISDGLRLSRYFTIILGGDSVKNRKPATEGVELILERTGIARSRAVMIGDGPNDVLTAKNAGIASIYVTYGFNPPLAVESLAPDFTIDDLRAIIGIC